MIGAVRRLLRHPPKLWGPLVLHRVSGASRQLGERTLDRWRSTYFPVTRQVELRPLLGPVLYGVAPAAWLGPVCELFHQHRFDWLGLGWRAVGYGAAPSGLGGYRYHPVCPFPDRDGNWLVDALPGVVSGDARNLWEQIDWPYEPIDWQRDHRSGYRWAEKTASRDVKLEPAPGADPKQPWELARLQHLPILAMAHALSESPADALRHAREFRNVVLDFAAANPPRLGINWHCSMDVAIRICNVLLAWDLFRSHGADFDPEFEQVLGRMAIEHGKHLRGHLEKRPDFAANHYLADLAGLLFAAAYVPGYPAAREWKRFAAREFKREIGRQFNADGSNFEASIGYHRLSGELCVYVMALLLGDRAPELDGLQAAAIVKGIASFTEAVCRPDGTALPVGDLDSGRFVKLASTFEPVTSHDATARYPHLAGTGLSGDAAYWDERLDLHGHLPMACATILAAESGAVLDTVESRVLKALAGGSCLAGAGVAREVLSTRLDVGDSAGFAAICAQGGQAKSMMKYEFPLTSGEPQVLAFRDFGLFIVRTSHWHLSIRCGSVGQHGNGGHAHNDQLGLTLFCDRDVVIEDPGVFVYNALPESRKQYRSVRAHFTPRPQSGEPGDLTLGAFRLGREGEGRCHWFGPLGFAGSHEGFGFRVMRVVRWDSQRLSVRDYSFGAPLVDLMPEGEWRPPVPVSTCYGRALS